jgi:hypothetical protein
MIFSCIWGFALGTAKFREGSARRPIIIAGLAGAIVLHGIFNFSLEVYEVAGLVFILVLIIPLGLWYTRENIKKAQADPASAYSLMQRSSSSGTGLLSEENSGNVAGTDLPGQHPATVSTNTGRDQDRTTKMHYCTSCGTHVVDGARFCRNCGKEL